MQQNENITVDRYRTLTRKKETKLKYMDSVQRFLDPNDGQLDRKNAGVEGEVIWDTTGRNLLEEYSFHSLSDIINPFEEWFTLNIAKNKDTDEGKLLDWCARNTRLFFNFIGAETSYYTSVLQDKVNFDAYGFSGMSFIRRNGKLKVGVEDPFSIIINDDSYDDVVREVYWIIQEDLFTLKNKYKVDSEVLDVNDPENNKKKYDVLCCLVPNDSLYVENPDMDNPDKYVFLRFLFTGNNYGDEAQKDAPNVSVTNAEEIGERAYFKEPFIVTPRDRKKSENPYAVGLGKRLLVPTQNLNQIRRDVLSASATYGDPPKTVPHDTWIKLESGEVTLSRGSHLPVSMTGEKIEPIVPQIDFRAQVELLQYEDVKIQRDVPQQAPPQKNARQSQFEIDVNLSQSAQIQLIYKMIYLNYGVAEHLKLMFNYVMDNGILEDLPEGVKREDVSPSLATVLLREFKKAKAQSYVQTINLLNPFVSISPEAMDNFDIDEIARNTALANGSGDVLLDEDTVDQIRQQREQVQAQQEQAEQQALNDANASKSTLNSAQANKASVETQLLQQKLAEGG